APRRISTTPRRKSTASPRRCRACCAERLVQPARPPSRPSRRLCHFGEGPWQTGYALQTHGRPRLAQNPARPCLLARGMRALSFSPPSSSPPDGLTPFADETFSAEFLARVCSASL